MIQGLTRRNDYIGLDELVWALEQVELRMSETDNHKLFSHYQKNWNQPKIDWREFAENLRRDLTDRRCEAIRKAYTKLDPEQTSKVTIDDVAKTYNVQGARDVVNGHRSEE